MGIFTKSERADDAKIAQLMGQLTIAQEVRKKLAAALAAEQQKTAGLLAQVEAGQIELEKMKIALLKTRHRQKASVERANRYKSRLVTPEIPVRVNL